MNSLVPTKGIYLYNEGDSSKVLLAVFKVFIFGRVESWTGLDCKHTHSPTSKGPAGIMGWEQILAEGKSFRVSTLMLLTCCRERVR